MHSKWPSMARCWTVCFEQTSHPPHPPKKNPATLFVYLYLIQKDRNYDKRELPPNMVHVKRLVNMMKLKNRLSFIYTNEYTLKFYITILFMKYRILARHFLCFVLILINIKFNI